MTLFNRKHKEDLKIQPPTNSRVEVELHKSAGKEAKKKADNANAHLSELLDENGFTLKIYLAAGGKIKRKTQSHGH